MKARRRRAEIRTKNQITLPAEISKALHVGVGDEIELDITDSGEIVLRGLTVVPAHQRWFWEENWQAGEKDASEQIAAGETTTSTTPRRRSPRWTSECHSCPPSPRRHGSSRTTRNSHRSTKRVSPKRSGTNSYPPSKVVGFGADCE